MYCYIKKKFLLLNKIFNLYFFFNYTYIENLFIQINYIFIKLTNKRYKATREKGKS